MSLFGKRSKKKEQEQTPPKVVIPADIQEKEFLEIYELCKPYTMTSLERMYALYNGVKYVLNNNIPGDFVEAGVWKGGSSMVMARLLSLYNITDRKIIMYDTYEGMPPPTDADKDYTGEAATSLLEKSSIEDQSSVWCYSSFDEVKANMQQTGLPETQIIMIKGKVEDTIPAQLPTSKISILRLDTDWYESTRHELIHLYPLLAGNGVLIIDDYGHWAGSRKAVDEYFAANHVKLLLNRIDDTGRFGIKNL